MNIALAYWQNASGNLSMQHDFLATRNSFLVNKYKWYEVELYEKYYVKVKVSYLINKNKLYMYVYTQIRWFLKMDFCSK